MNRKGKGSFVAVGILFTVSLAMPGWMVYALYHLDHPKIIWATLGTLTLLIVANWVLVLWSSSKSSAIVVPTKVLPSTQIAFVDRLSPLQIEIFELQRDLKHLLSDAGPAPILIDTNPGPMPKGANSHTWMEQKKIDSDKWMGAYSEWARKIIYKYKQEFSEPRWSLQNRP